MLKNVKERNRKKPFVFPKYGCIFSSLFHVRVSSSVCVCVCVMKKVEENIYIYLKRERERKFALYFLIKREKGFISGKCSLNLE